MKKRTMLDNMGAGAVVAAFVLTVLYGALGGDAARIAPPAPTHAAAVSHLAAATSAPLAPAVPGAGSAGASA